MKVVAFQPKQKSRVTPQHEAAHLPSDYDPAAEMGHTALRSKPLGVSSWHFGEQMGGTKILLTGWKNPRGTSKL